MQAQKKKQLFLRSFVCLGSNLTLRSLAMVTCVLVTSFVSLPYQIYSMVQKAFFMTTSQTHYIMFLRSYYLLKFLLHLGKYLCKANNHGTTEEICMHWATGAHYIPKAHHFRQMQADLSLSSFATSTGTKFVHCVCHLSIAKRNGVLQPLDHIYSQVTKKLTAVLSPQSNKPKSYKWQHQQG